MREEITDSIEQIPFTIDIVHKLSGVYNEKALQAHVSQLFVAILELLQECLIWLTKNPFRKVASAVFKGDDHAAGLTEKRKQLVRLGERIDKYAMAGLHENVRDAKSTLQEVRQGRYLYLSAISTVKDSSAVSQNFDKEIAKC